MTKKLSEKDWFKGWILLQQLEEQFSREDTSTSAGGVTQARMGDAYFFKEKIMQEVQRRILEMAPHGVQSQGEFLELLEKALNSADEDYKKVASSSGDESVMADIQLTLAMIERTLRMVPFQVFFSQNTE